MSNQELINYIKQSLSQGYAKEQIKSALLREGWAETDIEEGFRQAVSGPAASIAGENQPQTGQKLISVDNLFKQTWEFYKSNFLKIIAILGLPYLILLLIHLIPGISSTTGLAAALVSMDPAAILSFIWLYLIFIIVYAILYIWANVALLHFIKSREENIGVFKSYKKSVRQMLSYVWISIILTFVLIGSSLLLVVPGIITAIWIIFAPYVLVWENKKGFSALLRSRELVKGFWRGVFGRYLLISAFLFVVAFTVRFISNLLISSEIIKSIINLALNILISSFVICYGFFIYQSLAKIKGPVAMPAKKTWFVATFILGIVAILLIPIILSFVVLGSLNKTKLQAKDAAIKMSLIELRSRAEVDFETNGDYGAVCVETGGAASNSAISYPAIAANINDNGGNGVCNESMNSVAYAAWSKLSRNKYWCVDSRGNSRELNTEPPRDSVVCPVIVPASLIR